MNIPVHTGSDDNRGVAAWLAVVCGMLVAMVVVGGITRLTHSGLSIVEWAPLMGVAPPLTEADWIAAFESYQQYPEYRLRNRDMDLAGFKAIYFWEYLHRLLGRLIGVVVLLPWLHLLARGRLRGRRAARMGLILALGGLQGALGWYMVKSGLVDRPDVSHLRLAAHLGMAFLILGLTLDALLSALPSAPPPPAPRYLLPASRLLVGAVYLQVILGALVAGLRAGLGHNTFPKMNGQWLPDGAFTLQPWWLDLVENPVTVQFLHSTLAWLLLGGIVALWWRARRDVGTRVKRALDGLLVAVVVQFMLGVATLLWMVPIPLAVLHQLGGCALFGVAVILHHVVGGASARAHKLPNPSGPANT
ncbi:MAG: COX15/CtaA family protein [Myxococcota bacterium]